MTRLHTVVFLLLAAASFTQAPNAKNESKLGRVEGVVLDGEGKPLPGATVTSYLPAAGAARDVNQYQADRDGRFSLLLPQGKAWLSAHKDSDGYPYAFFAFYITPGQQFPTVEVKPGETTKGVVVRVGAKAAHLNYEVVDQDGKPVLGGFVFSRLDQKEPYQRSAAAKDDLLVPPAPFRAAFEAKGFKTWHYGGDKWRGNDGVISLKSGEALTLTIRLQPE